MQTTVSMPPEVKKLLDERAGNRPIYRMLLEDFLHEPDTDQLIKLKFKAVEQKIGDRLEKIEKKLDHVGKMLAANFTIVSNHEQYFKDMRGTVFPAIQQELTNIGKNFSQQHQANLEIGSRLAALEGD